MIAICWALRIDTTPALRKKESAMVKLEATVAAREKEATVAAQKKEADLQKRILAEFNKMAAVGRIYRIVEKSDSFGAKILDPAMHSDALMICGLVMPCLLQVSQTRHCCFHRFRECHVVFGLKPFWTFEIITMDHAQTVHR